MSNTSKPGLATQPPIYILNEWRGTGWAEVARGDDPYELQKLTDTMGDIGEDWTISCACGASSVFYGCESSAHV